MRDGVIRLSYEKSVGIDGKVRGDITGDNLPTTPYVLITCFIVAVAATLGAVCTQIEVVLAYKGGIFGSLMVYILPALMRTAIAEQTLSSLKYGSLAGGPTSLTSGRPTSINKNKNAITVTSAGSSGSSGKSSTRRKDYSEVAVQSPLVMNGEEPVSYVAGGINDKNKTTKSSKNEYLHLAQQDAFSNHSNFTMSSSEDLSVKQSNDFLFDDEIRTNTMASSMTSRQLSTTASEKLYGVLTPEGVVEVIKTMYTKSDHWKCAFLFTWGVGSGLLSVGITILKQTGVIPS
jgi:hypothetical protein